MEELIKEYGIKEKRKALNLYWKLEWLRQLLSKYLAYQCYCNEGQSYWLRIVWNFICGYSLIDSFYYDPQTPSWLKKALMKLKTIVYV